MIFLILLKTVLSNLGTGTVEAAPVNFSSRPTSDNASPSYVPKPRGRGTTDLLLTSIITLMLCVYTSIHLNIAADSHMFSINIPRFRSFLKRKKLEDTPGSNSDNAKEPYEIGVKRATVYKFYWVLIALFAPEFVFYAALDQWQEARALRKKLQDMGERTNIGVNNATKRPEEQVREISTSIKTIDGCSMSGDTSNNGVKDAATKPEEQIRERIYLELLKPTLPSPVGKADWSKVSMTSAFFVIMGGFAYRRGYDLEILESDPKFPHISLTAEGFLELAQKGVLHPGILDDKAIADRSKADWLAKLLVCAQALWMVFNVMGRKASGLPSTLIELNVIVHVVVMVVVYGLWWNKPLAVQNPVILNPSPEYNDGHTQMLSVLMSFEKNVSDISELCHKIVTLHEDDFPLTMMTWASPTDYFDDNNRSRRAMFKNKRPPLFWFCCRFSCNWGNYRNSPISVMTAEEHHQRYSDISFPEGLGWNYHVATEKTSKSEKGKGKQTIGAAVTGVSMNGENCTKGLRLQPGEVLLLGNKNAHGHRYAVVTRYRRPVFLTEHQIHVIEEYMVAFNEYPSFTGQCSWGVPEAGNIQQEGSVSDWRREIADKIRLPFSVFVTGATILSLIYAGCHATAWNSHFPSFTERYLWRGSCIVIAAGVPVLLLWLAINNILDSFETFVDNHKFYHRLCRSILQYLHNSMFLTNLLFLLAIILLYPSARIFIIVEAFISMRSLPAGAYDSVDWIEIIPHV